MIWDATTAMWRHCNIILIHKDIKITENDVISFVIATNIITLLKRYAIMFHKTLLTTSIKLEFMDSDWYSYRHYCRESSGNVYYFNQNRQYHFNFDIMLDSTCLLPRNLYLNKLTRLQLQMDNSGRTKSIASDFAFDFRFYSDFDFDFQ